MSILSRETFLEDLHDTLNHLYNADLLRKSPLAEVFGVANRFDTSTALRKILIEAIDNLKPPQSEPDQSKAWRIYESLYCCFIQQLNQQVVADQLSISPRQLRREQRNALENLADLLWQQYNLGHIESQSTPTTPEPAQELKPPHADLIDELGWLADAQPVRPNALSDALQAAIELVRPLAKRTGVTLRTQIGPDLPALAIHPAVLDQVLVSLLGAAIEAAAGMETTGGVLVSASKLPMAARLTLHLQPIDRPAHLGKDGQTSLDIAAELAHLSGGRLIRGSETPFPLQLVLPALEQFPVLVVDDNEDVLRLFKRYAEGSRYSLFCTRETDQALLLAEKIRPRIIVLDIMMPKENGWIVLGRLRQHPTTRETPVIICTILPQESLALSLGASAFLKKPVSRQNFLQALDHQFALQEPEFG